MREKIVKATDFRREILDARDDANYEALSFKLARADDQLEYLRVNGDVVLSAFFAENNKAKRKEELGRLKSLKESGEEGEFKRITEEMRAHEKPLVPFHWEIELAEVFRLDANLHVQGGFDAVVGNPPFAGRNTLIEGTPAYYAFLNPQSKANADLSAHFYRRAFSLLRPSGCFGLIATKTICQGESRFTGLRWIGANGGTVYFARRRLTWPGEATVTISVVCVIKGVLTPPFLLNGKRVKKITAYLFPSGGSEDPEMLKGNKGKASEGTKIYGPGFTFDDDKPEASPVSEIEVLTAANNKNAERIFKYLGGDEVNKDPKHLNRRFVVDFADFPLRRQPTEQSWYSATARERDEWLRSGVVPSDYPDPVAADWPDLLRLVEDKVLQYRASQSDETARRIWWRFQRRRKRLYAKLSKLKQAIVICNSSDLI